MSEAGKAASARVVRCRRVHGGKAESTAGMDDGCTSRPNRWVLLGSSQDQVSRVFTPATQSPLRGAARRLVASQPSSCSAHVNFKVPIEQEPVCNVSVRIRPVEYVCPPHFSLLQEFCSWVGVINLNRRS